MKKIIHVNRHNIKYNKTAVNYKFPFAVKTWKKNHLGFTVDIRGPAKLVYTPDKPLKCGATAYIVTESDVYVDGNLI